MWTNPVYTIDQPILCIDQPIRFASTLNILFIYFFNFYGNQIVAPSLSTSSKQYGICSPRMLHIQTPRVLSLFPSLRLSCPRNNEKSLQNLLLDECRSEPSSLVICVKTLLPYSTKTENKQIEVWSFNESCKFLKNSLILNIYIPTYVRKYIEHQSPIGSPIYTYMFSEYTDKRLIKFHWERMIIIIKLTLFLDNLEIFVLRLKFPSD